MYMYVKRDEEKINLSYLLNCFSNELHVHVSLTILMYSKFSLIFNLEILPLVVFFGSVTSQNVSAAATGSGSSFISTSTPVTTRNGTESGGDAVSISYYMFALTLLGAYFMQFMEH